MAYQSWTTCIEAKWYLIKPEYCKLLKFGLCIKYNPFPISEKKATIQIAHSNCHITYKYWIVRFLYRSEVLFQTCYISSVIKPVWVLQILKIQSVNKVQSISYKWKATTRSTHSNCHITYKYWIVRFQNKWNSVEINYLLLWLQITNGKTFNIELTSRY